MDYRIDSVHCTLLPWVEHDTKWVYGTQQRYCASQLYRMGLLAVFVVSHTGFKSSPTVGFL